MIKIEFVTYSYDSALMAEKYGADRIELCNGVFEGGTTPSYGLIKLCKENLKIPINIMIRPRGGDFLYSDSEFAVMKSDISNCKLIGVNGIVFGILDTNGNIDIPRCRELVELSKPMQVTFHRAFDVTSDPIKALYDIIECGFDRILTSGQKQTAMIGIELISELVKLASNKIIIMPGGGVRENNIKDLINLTKAREYHTSALKLIKISMKYINSNISMGLNKSNENDFFESDPNIISQFMNIVNNL